MTAGVQLRKKYSGRYSQGVWRQDELIGGKQPLAGFCLDEIRELKLENLVEFWRVGSPS
jgi:hypothetical protein